MEEGTLRGRLHKFYRMNEIQMRARGEGVKKSENLEDIKSGSYLDVTLILQL